MYSFHNDANARSRTIWNPSGKMVAKYRKMHLFDVDIPGTPKASILVFYGTDGQAQAVLRSRSLRP